MEVIVALVILEIGLLGVAGLAVRAFQLLSHASERSRAALAVEEVVDSLAAAGVREDGVSRFEVGTVRWTLTGERGIDSRGRVLREITVAAVDPTGEGVLTAHGVLAEAGAE